MKVGVQYGEGWMELELPVEPIVIRYGTDRFPRIPLHPNPQKAVEEALDNPIGGPSLDELIKRGGVKKVSISFDDPTRVSQVIQTALPIVIKRLKALGISKRDMILISANGAHNKWTRAELRNHIGSAVFDEFCPPDATFSRVVNHDCTQDLVNLGESKYGDVVEYNKVLVETDLHIHCGTITPLAYGGYSGQGIVVGLMGIGAANSHHGAHVFMHPDACHGDPDPAKNIYRRHKLACHEKIEEATKNRIFYVDCIAVIGEGVVEAFAGYVPELEKVEYPRADRYFKVKVRPADVLILGTPPRITYDSLDNPLVLSAYLLYPLRLARDRALLKKDGVIIAPVKCKGVFSEKRPGDPKAYELLGKYYDVEDLWFENIDAFWANTEYLFKYRYEYAYAPWHCLWGATNPLRLKTLVREVILFGEIKPGIARYMGFTPAKSWKEAWKLACDIVGPDPQVTVLPAFWAEPRPVFVPE
jgi:hypothetical protein